MLANHDATTGWKRSIQACGPEWGYWPRLRVDDADRTHVLFGGGWATRTQRAYYVRLDPAGRREVGRSVDSGYMSSGALAMTLDDAGEPVVMSNGKLVAADGTKTPIFTDSTSQSFMEVDADGAIHVVGNTMIPDSPTSSTSRMRYAHRDASGTVTIEVPRTAPVARPLGLVLDSAGQPHILSYNSVTAGGGELWHTTRTGNGWVETLIASDVLAASAAMVIDANDELLVVAPGRLHRRAATAVTWTTRRGQRGNGGGRRNIACRVSGRRPDHVEPQRAGARLSRVVHAHAAVMECAHSCAITTRSAPLLKTVI